MQAEPLSDSLHLEFPSLSSELVFSLLFHFCTLVSFISLGGIRTLIKFYYILISKASKLISQISFIELFRPSMLMQQPLTNLGEQKNTYLNNINANNNFNTYSSMHNKIYKHRYESDIYTSYSHHA